jgi:hypothetical protein
MPKSTRTFRAPSASATAQRARPPSFSPASDDDVDDLPHHSRPHRPRHDPAATKRVTVRKTPEQVRALNIAFQHLGARPSQSDRRRLALEIGLVSLHTLPLPPLNPSAQTLCLGWQRGPFDPNDIIQPRSPSRDPGAFSLAKMTRLNVADSLVTPPNSLSES